MQKLSGRCLKKKGKKKEKNPTTQAVPVNTGHTT